MTKPFIKWAGGKTQLLPDLSRLIPVTTGRYFEVFIGGGAPFFHFANRSRFSSAVINDLNPELTNLYKVVRDRLPELIVGLTAVLDHHNWNTQEYFTAMRSSEPQDSIERAVRFIYLNRTCFNGLYRVNRAGKFNVPFGRHKNPKLIDIDNLKLCSSALQGVVIRTGSFLDATRDVVRGDVVYFDPPYVPISATSSFTSYAGEFDESHQRELAEWFKVLVQRGVACVLSNSDAPLVRDLYREFGLHTVSARRSVNSDATKRGTINEIVVVGIPDGHQHIEIPTIFDSLESLD